MSMTRESSIEESKQYRIKSNRGLLKNQGKSQRTRNSKIKMKGRLLTSSSIKITQIYDPYKSKNSVQSPERVDVDDHRRIIKTVINKC
mmetsp:Transcript_32800/g.29095  ORF Transcript_32800/g.29095 Transcript_32800/m.29095 type:complete len:88 (+) Transcript_32800:110-373(+)